MKDTEFKEWLEQAYTSGRALTSNLADDISKKLYEQTYSKRELDDHFKDIKVKLEEIRIQTTKTNGRVSNQENRWSYLYGALSLGSLVLLLVGYIWSTNISQVKAEISGHIKETTITTSK